MIGRGSPLLSVQCRFWELIAEGLSSEDAAVAVGVSGPTGSRWFCRFGGVNPRLERSQGCRRPRLTHSEREQIMIGISVGESIRSIARRLGRAPSTILREIDKNSGVGPARSGRHRSGAPYRRGNRTVSYSARLAQQRSEHRARRPKATKLSRCVELRDRVQALLVNKYSPAQIAGVLAVTYPDRPEMQMSHETLYKELYVQGRGELRRELTRCLRTGRTLRKPRKRAGAQARGRIPGMVNISERPAEADDRAVPGHWEGDLIIGKNNASAIGTVVERATGYLMLLHLPKGRGVEHVTAALTQRLIELPDSLRQSLTWDQGKELSQHARVSVDAGIDIYFADPHTPWHRPSNENTNGLLRQYFPKGTDLSIHTAEHLRFVENEMNDRPRKRLDFLKPQELMTQLLLGV
jgi:transposase, IS30 family